MQQVPEIKNINGWNESEELLKLKSIETWMDKEGRHTIR